MNIIRQIYFMLFAIAGAIFLPAVSHSQKGIPDLDEQRHVDSLMSSMTLEQKVGQLFVVRANQPWQEYDKRIIKYIRDYHIGGVTFFGGSPTAQALQTNEWQSASEIPLLVSIDAEWGLGMRLDSVIAFPYQMTLGAVADENLIYQMGKEIARQCRRMGIHMNFAPVVDINSNPLNPVIHLRSFGEDRQEVTARSLAYMKGLQDGGVVAVAKHFPGHGDTDTDSHKTLPVVDHLKPRIDSMELYPYPRLIEEGLLGVMTAHLSVPAYEPSANLPATLSPSIVTGLLREELGFDGLIITDALDMKGVTSYFKPGDIEVRALKAGNDILLLSEDIPRAVKSIVNSVKNGEIEAQEIDRKCRKILSVKYRLGLTSTPKVDISNLVSDLNSPKALALNRKLFGQAVTLLRNANEIIPVKGLDTLRIASIVFGKDSVTKFQEALSRYAPVRHFVIGYDMAEDTWRMFREQLEEYDLVIIAFQGTSSWNATNFGVPERFWHYAEELSLTSNVILDLFTSPYALNKTGDFPGFEGLIISYQDHPLAGDLSAQAIFGGSAFRGRIPVTADDLQVGSGLDTQSTRLAYVIPEEIGIDSRFLEPIDSLLQSAIRLRVFPGCQVVAAKDGAVFYRKSFGYHTYTQGIPVENHHLYDIASLTKIASTTLATMKLSEEDMLDIDRGLGYYLPYVRGTDKEDIIIREMLAHQARFRAWIPYYEYTLVRGLPDKQVYSDVISEDFPTRVAEGMYIRKDYQKIIFDSIRYSPLRKENSYLYSDLGFYLLKEIIELRTNEPLQDYVAENFYRPLGLYRTGFLPRKYWDLDEIVPTELDKTFRMQLLHGDVQDQGAAMTGGVSGHAGLFSDAGGLAVIMQMLLQEGSYGGEKYFEPATVREFTRRQFPLNENRRGIGFDKPMLVYEKDGPNCMNASPASFGHSGFTGTYMWADPENGLVYVFLSNRVHPNARNNKISELNIRTSVHQMFYDAIDKSKKEELKENR